MAGSESVELTDVGSNPTDRTIEVECIHELPADIADLVDRDYFSPIAIFAEAPDVVPPDYPLLYFRLTDHIYVRVRHGLPPREPYHERYGKVSFYIYYEQDEINERDAMDAVNALNRALDCMPVKLLEFMPHDLRFEYAHFLGMDEPDASLGLATI